MFGYVLLRRDKLPEREQQRYQAAYCGLCRCLKRRYGFRGRFLVNYDMVFLYFLLQSREQTAERCFCPARILCKKPCLPQDEVMNYAADLTVLLSWWKLCDAQRDDRGVKRLAAGAAKVLYGGCYRRAAQRQPRADALFRQQLSRLQALEEQRCPSLDRTADAFASLLRCCVPEGLAEEVTRPLEQVLYHVGRFLYLTDALEDLPGDLRAHRYNPLQYRYSLREGKLSPEDREAFLSTVDASISMAGAAFELLPPSPHGELLENIIYHGLPAVLHSVAAGTFRKRSKE